MKPKNRRQIIDVWDKVERVLDHVDALILRLEKQSPSVKIDAVNDFSWTIAEARAARKFAFEAMEILESLCVKSET